MAGSSHSQIDKFQTIQGLPLFFQNNSKTFQFSEIQGLFKAGLEFKAGAGTLMAADNKCRLDWMTDDKSCD